MTARFNPGYADPKGILIFAPGGPALGGIFAVGTTVPADTSAGYCNGCIFIDRDATAGAQVWINEGTAASSLFKAVSTTSTASFTNATIINLTTTNQSLSGTQTMANNANFAFNTTNGTMLGTNTNQKIGAYGVTPVSQPVSTGELLGMNGNGATNANAVNWNSNGNFGATFHTFSDVVKCLKKEGWLPT